MNRLRQLCLTVALTLTLSLSAFAGEIECGLMPTPTPMPQTAEATPPATNDEAGGVEFVLTILQGVLSAF